MVICVAHLPGKSDKVWEGGSEIVTRRNRRAGVRRTTRSGRRHSQGKLLTHRRTGERPGVDLSRRFVHLVRPYGCLADD
jgi:hypothetical protein